MKTAEVGIYKISLCITSALAILLLGCNIYLLNLSSNLRNENKFISSSNDRQKENYVESENRSRMLLSAMLVMGNSQSSKDPNTLAYHISQCNKNYPLPLPDFLNDEALSKVQSSPNLQKNRECQANFTALYVLDNSINANTGYYRSIQDIDHASYDYLGAVIGQLQP